MSSNSILMPTLIGAGAGCVNFVGAEVTIDVTGPGTVVVYATTTMLLDHTTGDIDEVDLYVRDAPDVCGLDGWTTAFIVSPSQPTDSYFASVPMMGAFAVGAAGTYTYYINAQNFGVGDAIWLNAGVVAVFYPS